MIKTIELFDENPGLQLKRPEIVILTAPSTANKLVFALRKW